MIASLVVYLAVVQFAAVFIHRALTLQRRLLFMEFGDSRARCDILPAASAFPDTPPPVQQGGESRAALPEVNPFLLVRYQLGAGVCLIAKRAGKTLGDYVAADRFGCGFDEHGRADYARRRLVEDVRRRGDGALADLLDVAPEVRPDVRARGRWLCAGWRES